VTTRQLKKTLNIGTLFAAAISFPRQTAAEPELALKADGDASTNIVNCHDSLPPVFLRSAPKRLRGRRKTPGHTVLSSWRRCKIAIQPYSCSYMDKARKNKR
jgi:hypothetical protein